VARLAATEGVLPTPEGVPAPETVRPRYSPTIKQLPPDERPRERLAAYGPQALTTAELLAILIRVGNAQRSAVSLGEHLLAHFGNVREVACAPVEALAKVHGIGPAKAAQIKAAIEFGSRVSLFSGDARPTIQGPTDVSNLLMPDLRYAKKETLKSLLLTTKNQVIAVKTISIGDLSSSIVHPREVYQDAVIASAASIIIAHNHPSGDPTPSAEDVSVTRRLREAGEILGIELLDHIIIGDGTFVSLKERGKM
jgi:DNA repair protein RadC